MGFLTDLCREIAQVVLRESRLRWETLRQNITKPLEHGNKSEVKLKGLYFDACGSVRSRETKSYAEKPRLVFIARVERQIMEKE